MRIAKTIEDVADLLSDHSTKLQLTDKAVIEVEFPSLADESPIERPNDYSHISTKDPVYHTRKTRHVVRSLVGSNRFWRLTTVADQLHCFSMANNKSDSPYGRIRVRKTAGNPLSLLFDCQERSKLFFSDLENLND